MSSGKTNMEDLVNSQIIPGKGIGPFTINMSEEKIFTIIPANTPKQQVGKNFIFKCGGIKLWICAKSKILTQIGVESGFLGTLDEDIGIGTSIKDAKNVLGDLIVNEDFQLVSPAHPGVCFHTQPAINGENPEHEENAVIDGIYVFYENKA